MPDKNQMPGRPPTPGEIADDHDRPPSPEEWQKLKAEWIQDYGMRRMEDRGVKYEDEPCFEDARVSATARPLPSPSQIADQKATGQAQPQGHDHERGR